MFSALGVEQERSNLDRFTSWLGRASQKAKDVSQKARDIASATKDISTTLRPQPEMSAPVVITGTEKIWGMPKTAVYLGAGALVLGGIGYIVWNRMKKR